jgi:hypothetical protein
MRGKIMNTRHTLGRRARTALCISTVIGGIAAASVGTASAAATIDGQSAQYSRPYSTVLTLERIINYGSTSTSQLVETYGGSADNGARVDTWQRLIGDNQSWGGIIQPNQQWEFHPTAQNTGGTIYTGYGQLKNRLSGKCLEVFGASTSDLATVDQWDCNGGPHQNWTAEFSMDTGTVALKVQHSGMYLVANSFQCSNLPNNGTFLQVTQERNACTIFNPLPVSYSVASNRLPMASNRDDWDWDGDGHNRCEAGYKIRTYIGDPVYRDVSADGVAVAHALVATDILGGPHAKIRYTATMAPGQYGQVLLYCDPT